MNVFRGYLGGKHSDMVGRGGVNNADGVEVGGYLSWVSVSYIIGC